jgi:hypothetical protein
VVISKQAGRKRDACSRVGVIFLVRTSAMRGNEGSFLSGYNLTAVANWNIQRGPFPCRCIFAFFFLSPTSKNRHFHKCMRKPRYARKSARYHRLQMRARTTSCAPNTKRDIYTGSRHSIILLYRGAKTSFIIKNARHKYSENPESPTAGKRKVHG